ncbi:hypothetical protein [Rhodococcus koreensis]
MGHRSPRCTEVIHRILLSCLIVPFGLLIGISPAQSQPGQIVTVCGSDDAPGGLNLATALAQGGPITIRCPAGPQEIQVTQTRNLTADVALAGEGQVTFRGPSNKPMFTTSHSLKLSNLILINDQPAVTGSIVSGDKADITLISVVVTHSPSAFLARSLHAETSRFANNGDASGEASGSAVINAETIALHNSEFVANNDHPIAGGAWPTPDRTPLSRRVTIDETTFTDNRSTLLLIDAKVSIRASKFTQNGRLPATARDNWDCCGGAITLVRSDAEVSDSDFRGNGSSGFGGAIHSISSRLAVETSTFERNEARVGGAIMSFGRVPRVNIWSTDDWTDLPRLVLSHVTFNDNKATVHGGAIAFAGPVKGEGLVVRANKAGSLGGAIASWRAATLPEPYSGVLDAMSANTEPRPPDKLTLTRSVLVDNHADGSGAALAGADAETSVGNSIIARNSAASGATVTGSQLRLVNTVIADNAAPGIQETPGGTIAIGNSVILRNTANCGPGTQPAILGPNMQYPGSDCGSQIQTVDPGLDATYAPALVSSARDGGDVSLCISEPTVASIDLNGRTRIAADQKCSIGAIERDLVDSIAATLTFNQKQGFGHCLMWLLLILMLLAFIVGLIWRIRKRRA